MINFCLNEEEKSILKEIVGKKIVKFRHDPFDKFGGDTVYGNVTLFTDDSIYMIEYDYAPYPLFGSKDDDHPRFSIKRIGEEEAISFFSDVTQIDVPCNDEAKEIELVEDYADVEWDGKNDSTKILIAIIFRFKDYEMAIQGDYMMPLLDILKGNSLKDNLVRPGDEFSDDPETKFKVTRTYVDLH